MVKSHGNTRFFVLFIVFIFALIVTNLWQALFNRILDKNKYVKNSIQSFALFTVLTTLALIAVVFFVSKKIDPDVETQVLGIV